MYLLLKHKLVIIFLPALLALVAIVYAATHWHRQPAQHPIIDEIVSLPQHPQLRVVHSTKPEKGVLIFIADKNQTAMNSAYAKQFAELSYYVAIVDNQALLNSATNNPSQCLHLANQLAELSAQLHAQFQLGGNDLPILVGAESGAATLYAALAQAEKKTFHAAVSINFTPTLNVHTPLCDQDTFTVSSTGAPIVLKPVTRLASSFYIFQDKNLASNSAITDFADNINNAKLTIAKEENQTPVAEAIQILQWLDPRLADQISSDASDSDLPLIDVNSASAHTPTTDTMAILLTGDGGWADIDKQLAKILAAHGIPTVGFDSLSYFWKARTPATTSQDIEQVMTQYLEKWNKKKVILIGYSFGADVLPFVANNLTADAQQKVALVALLGMGKTAAFEFRLSSWMNADKDPNRLPLLPEIEKMKWANSICIYGVADDAANCLPTAALGVKIISMSGDHHFDEKYDDLVQHIMDNAAHK
jgi:type IV secretory pathway VirJ component